MDGFYERVKGKVSSEHMYFSYGSNMSRKKLETRAVSQDVPIGYSECYIARLPDWTLCFNLRGAPPTEPVMASIEPSPGDEVYGMVYKFKSDECWMKLLATEGITDDLKRDSYHVIDVEVETKQGKMKVKTLFTNPRFVVSVPFRPYIRPSRRYMNILIKAAQDEEIPEHYVEKLKNVKVARRWEMSPLLWLMRLGMPMIFLVRRAPYNWWSKPVWTLGFWLYAMHEKLVTDGREEGKMRIDNKIALGGVRVALFLLYALYVLPAIIFYGVSPMVRELYHFIDNMMTPVDEQ